MITWWFYISEYSLMAVLLEYLNSSFKVQTAEKRQSVAGLQAALPQPC